MSLIRTSSNFDEYHGTFTSIGGCTGWWLALVVLLRHISELTP